MSSNYTYNDEIMIANTNEVNDQISLLEVYLKTCIKENSNLKKKTKELNEKINSINEQLELYKNFDEWYYMQNIFKRLYWHIMNYNKTYLINNFFKNDENL